MLKGGHHRVGAQPGRLPSSTSYFYQQANIFQFWIQTLDCVRIWLSILGLMHWNGSIVCIPNLNF